MLSLRLHTQRHVGFRLKTGNAMAALFLGFSVIINLGLNTLAGRLEFDSKGDRRDMPTIFPTGHYLHSF